MNRSRLKQMLLPMSTAVAQRISLENHLSLETLLSGSGEEHHFNGMCQAACIASFLCEAGYGAAREGLFGDAERVLLDCRRAGIETENWRFDNASYFILAEILTLHDTQFFITPVRELIRANERLKTHNALAAQKK
ncbi:Fis family transcriptional regulator [Paraburkholderia sp. MMS20-SJTR3]|uniref:Fis family transcriptional regulator n=1 Tax=Paraburkholderia sejongensis TaxID=2886946 RepID=A0ABS8K6V1_9BURK|nr:Fis family transcriptional regulator [Paraburkholderia sp. MMS20-SJTR3]MCC8397659.1 Fis family transcriptional regulator [Paraburkholderia sp. MMS20-SJTR3]